jgi:hypothetical protein
MKKLLFVFLLSAITFNVSAEIYKSIDRSGKTIYSDVPPPPENSNVSIVNTTVPIKAGQHADWEAKDQALRQRMMGREKDLAKENLAAEAVTKACDSARTVMKQIELTHGRRTFRRDSNGERVYITDEERSAIEIEAQHSIAKNCI